MRMYSKQLSVKCECNGTGWIEAPDAVGDDIQLFECAVHNPAYQVVYSVDDLIGYLGKTTGLTI